MNIVTLDTVPAPVPVTPARRTTRDEYKGHPLICIPLGRDRSFSLGKGKCKAIVDCIDEIRAFAAEE